MISPKRWRQVGQGHFHKWEIPAEELEGIWRGTHGGRTAAGLVTVPCPAALLDRVQRVQAGAGAELRKVRKCGPATADYDEGFGRRALRVRSAARRR